MIKQTTTHNKHTGIPCVTLDIETLSSKTNAAIVEAAGISFLVKEHELFIVDDFLYNIPARLYNKQEQFHIDSSTLAWWATSSGRDLANMPNKNSELKLIEHLQQLERIITGFVPKDTAKYFTRGVFDLPILANAIPKFNPVARDFRCFNDVRTLSSIPRVADSVPKPKNSHNALIDCLHNIKVIAAAYELTIRYSEACQYLEALYLPTTSSQLATQNQPLSVIVGQPFLL